MRQRMEESSDDFVSRLNNQANLCKFGERDERIIEQLTYGTKHAEVQKVLLVQDETYTLSKAIEACRVYDASEGHQRAFREIQGGEVTVHAVQQRGPPPAPGDLCYNCGESRHRSSQGCPARTSTCRSCGTIGHWAKAKACPRKQPSRDSSRSRYRSKSRNRFANRGRQRGRGRGGSSRGWHTRYDSRSVDVVQQAQHDDDESFAQVAYHAVTITVGAIEQSSAFATMELQLPNRPVNDTLKLKIDTGAQGNILPLHTYRRMFPRNLTTSGYPKSTHVTCRPEVKLTAYNGGEIKQHGAISLMCRYKHSEWHNVDFYIAESEGPAILGLASCKLMNIVSVLCDDIGIDVSAVNRSNIPVSAMSEIHNIEDLKSAFPQSFDTLGNFREEYHLTVDPTVAPVVHPCRKYAIQRREAIHDELNKMESMRVIARETEPTDWVSSLTFTGKRDGTLRLCLDPKDLNQALKRPHHKTPTLEEITHHFNGATFFSKLDAKNGYWAIRLDEASSKLTTFNTPFGRYRFLRLPFGLVVSQDVFQQRMDTILEKCPGCTGIADYVAVYGRTEKEHDDNLMNLMMGAQENGLIFNSAKCIIKAREIPSFGLIYTADGVKPDPNRVEAIRALPTPQNTKELQEFLGIATYMASFVPCVSHHSAVLRELLKRDTEYVWLHQHAEAFSTIKSLICKTTTLAYFDTSKDSVLQVDSSQKGLGAVLMQDSRPIAFASKSLTDTESRYANIERELVAVVYACERFHTYLYGKPFVVQSDHKPLEMIQLKNLHAAPPRLQRMLLRLQNYGVIIRYQPGKTLLLADGLSRLVEDRPDPPVQLDVRVNLVQFSSDRVEQLREETAHDPVLAPLRDIIVSGWPDTERKLPKLLKPYWSYRDELSIDDGVILKGSDQVLVPVSMQQYILSALHAGHQGRDKCRLRAKASVHWNGIAADIESYVARCTICQQHAQSQQKEPLRQKDIPPYTWHTLSAYFFELDGKEYLLIVDHYSKLPFVRSMGRSCTSIGAITYFRELFGSYGSPEILYTDNGPQFDSYAFKEFAKRWSFVHTTSSPRYAQSNGFAERMVQTVKNTLRKAKMDDLDPDLALLCLRTTPISNKIRSPMELLMSRKGKANLPVNMRNQLPDAEQIGAAFRDRQDLQKRNYNLRAGTELPQLYAGQYVRFQQHPSSKWTPARIVKEADEPRSYVLETSDGSVLRRSRHHIAETPLPRAPATELQRQPKRVRFLDDVMPAPAQAQLEATPAPTVTTEPIAERRDGFSRYGRPLKKARKLNM